jgi:hypothetical protein
MQARKKRGKKHWLINYIDTKAKCRHLKNLPVKRLYGGCLSEFIDWRYLLYNQSCWYFRLSFVNCCPSNLLSASTLPPSSFLCVKVQYIQTACGWQGVGVLSPVADHILQEFNTLYPTKFTTYKIARPPQTKTLEWRGPQTDKHLLQSPSSIF